MLRGPGELLLETLRDQTEWFSAQTLECKADGIIRVLDAAAAWVLLRLAQWCWYWVFYLGTGPQTSVSLPLALYLVLSHHLESPSRPEGSISPGPHALASFPLSSMFLAPVRRQSGGLC